MLEGRVVPTITVGSSAWTAVGPAPVDISSGRITAVAGDPNNANIIYIAAAGGGVWKTTNAGTSWTPLTDNQATLFMGALAVAPSNSQVIYAGTGEANNSGDSFYGEGVLKSTDGGATWTQEDNGGAFDRKTISKIVVDPTNANIVYAAIDDFGVNGTGGNVGVWKSSDGGATWTNTTTAISTSVEFSDLAINPSNPQIVYAAAGTPYGDAKNGVYETTDGGQSWSAAGNFPMGGSDGRIAIAISASSPTTLYAAINNADESSGLVAMEKSTDGGTTWSVLSSCPNFMVGGQGWYDIAVAVDPTNPNVVYGAGVIDYGNNNKLIVTSQDGGSSWTDLTHDSTGAGPHTDIHALAFDANDKLLLGGDGGIWRLDDDVTGSTIWTDINSNLQITQFTGIALDPDNPDILYGGSQDNGTEEYGGNLAWPEIYGGDGGFVAVDPNNPEIVYTENYDISLARSNDGGQTWTDITSGLNLNDRSNFYVPYVTDPTTSGRLVYGTDHIYETTDYGNDWTIIASPGQSGFNSNGNSMDSVAISQSDPNTIYAVGGGQVYVTHNNGTTWTTSNPTNVNDSFNDVIVDPTNANIAYIARNAFNSGSETGQVFETTDGGVTWTNISGTGSGTLPDIPTDSLALGSIDGVNYLWAGTDTGVYASTDGGAHWSRYLTGMPNVQVVSLDFSASLDLLAAGTHGRGAFEVKPGSEIAITPVTPTGIVEEVPFSGEVATFTDSDPAAIGDYSAEIVWGDGTSSAGTIQTNPAGGFEVIASTTYALGGNYTATITVSKSLPTAVSSSISETINVAADPLNVTAVPINAIQDETFSGEVATFIDTYPLATTASDYTATIAWGDGSTTSGTVTSNGAGGFEVSGSTLYGTAASGDAVVTIMGLGGAVATEDVPYSVLPAVDISPVSISPTIGEPFTDLIATFTSNNPDMPAASTFSALIAWGDGTTAVGNVTLGAGGVYSITGSKTYNEVGPAVVSITVTDGFGAIDSASETISIADATITPSGVVFQAVEGTPYSGEVATFQDPYETAPASYFSATISWGDGASSVGTVLSDGGGNFEVDGEHSYTQERSYTTGVVIRDASGQVVSVNGTADVGYATLTPIPETLTVVAGSTLNGVIGSFGDTDAFANSGDFSAEILWGDGTSSAGSVRPNASGGYDVVGTKTYGNVGPFTAQIEVFEGAHLSTTIDSTVNVTASPLSAFGQPFTDVEGDATTPHAVAYFFDADTITQPASYYSATINWGDGSVSAGTIVAIPGGGFDVDGEHAYQAGTYPVFISISDTGGASATAGTTATITPAGLTAGPPETVSAAEGSPITQPIGTFTDGNIYAPATNFTAEINWGDGTTTAGVITALGGGDFSVSGPTATPHAYASGVYGYSILVTDFAGPTTTISGSAVISPAAIAAQADPITAQEGFTFNGLVASFTDTAPQVNPASSFVVTISWGDGSSSAGTVTSPSVGDYDVTGSHDYPTGGSYVVTTSIESRGGAGAIVTSSATVAPASLTASGLFITPTEGVAYTGPVATFTDANPSHPSVRDFVAIIDWGDDSEAIGTVTFDPSTDLYSVSGSHVYNAGAYPVGVSISDTAGATTSTVSTAYVAASALTARPTSFDATEAEAFSGVVATFTDADPREFTPSEFQAAIFWGDGAVSSGTIAVIPGGYAVTGDHIYNTVGTEVVGVLIESVGGASAATKSTATVSAGTVSVAIATIPATQDVPFSGVVANFTDSDPFLPASDFSAEISWGDSTFTSGSVVEIAPGTYQVDGSHTYSEGGPESVSVSVTGSGGSAGTSTSASLLVPVANQLYPISIEIDPATDTGVSNSDAITADQSPILEGTSEPGAVVSLFAERSPVASMIAIGSVQADATGHWLVQVGPLSPGTYSLFASAVDASGRPSTPLTAEPIGTSPTLVIDDTAPTVVSTALDPGSETFTIVFGDDLSGVSKAAIYDSAIYQLSEPFAAGAPTFSPASVSNPYPNSSGTSEVVQVTFSVPRRDRTGKLVLTIQGADITDLAGNTLVESHYVPLPSQGDRPGNVYQAQFVSNGKTASGPEQYFSPAELKSAAQARKLNAAAHSKKK